MQNHYPLVNGILITPAGDTYEFFDVELDPDLPVFFDNIATSLNLPSDDNDDHPLDCCYTGVGCSISDDVKITVTDIDLPGVDCTVDTSDLSRLFELAQVFYDYQSAGVQYFLDYGYEYYDHVSDRYAGSYESDHEFLDDLFENGFLGINEITDEDNRINVIFFLDKKRIIAQLMEHDFAAYSHYASNLKSYFYLC